MTIKQLFDKIETANFIASQAGTGKFFISCEEIAPITDGQEVLNQVNQTYRFYKWDDFACSIAYDYSEDVCKLLRINLNPQRNKGEFVLIDDKIVKDFGLRFFICKERI